MRYLYFWAIAVFLMGCPTRARVASHDGGDGGTNSDGSTTPDDGSIDEGGSPSIAIVAPASMIFANANVTIQVQVSGGTATQVQLLRNDVAWQDLSGPPFQFTWDTTPAPDGDYVLTAAAIIGGKAITSGPVTVSVDHTPPRVTGVIPARGSASVDVAAPIKVTFSEPVLASSVNNSSVSLTAGAAAVPSTVALATDQTSLMVTISDPKSLVLPANFVATVAPTITDRAGNALAPLDPAWTWTVPAWIKLPPLATQMPPRLAVDASGRPVIIYVTSDTVNGNGVFNVQVARFDGGAWDLSIGAPTANVDTARYGYSIALDSKEQPVIAWTAAVPPFSGPLKVYVGAWTGSAWNTQFPPLDAINGASTDPTLPSVRVDPSDRPVVAWREQTGSFPTYDVFAARWDGTMWNRLNGTKGVMGGAGFSQLLDGPQLVLDAQGNPLFGWSEGNGVGTGVSFWTGTDWVPSQTLLPGYTPYPAIDAAGAPWIAVKSTDLHVVRWDRNTLNWPEATSALTTSSAWSAPRIALAPDGAPVVAWLDTSAGVRVGVARWTGTAWDTRFGVFNAGQNPLNNIVPELVVDARGKIWVAWKEGTAAQVWSSNY
jgi:hypothetical protein